MRQSYESFANNWQVTLAEWFEAFYSEAAKGPVRWGVGLMGG